MMRSIFVVETPPAPAELLSGKWPRCTSSRSLNVIAQSKLSLNGMPAIIADTASPSIPWQLVLSPGHHDGTLNSCGVKRYACGTRGLPTQNTNCRNSKPHMDLFDYRRARRTIALPCPVRANMLWGLGMCPEQSNSGTTHPLMQSLSSRMETRGVAYNHRRAFARRIEPELSEQEEYGRHSTQHFSHTTTHSLQLSKNRTNSCLVCPLMRKRRRASPAAT